VNARRRREDRPSTRAAALRRWLCAGAALCLACAAAVADTVALLPAARVRAGAPLTLGDVAQLQGPTVQALAGLALADDPRSLEGRVVTLEQVQQALASAGVARAAVAFSGGACQLRIVEPQRPAAPAAGPRDAPALAQDDASSLLAQAQGTILQRVLETLARAWAVEPADVRLRFSPRDEAFLRQPLAELRVEVEPAAALDRSARASLAVWVYREHQLQERRTIVADVELRRSVLTLTRPVARGAPIPAEATQQERRWLAPGGAPLLASRKALQGAVARARLEAGTVLRQSMLETPLLVRKGERVAVHYLGRALSLKLHGRALAQGRLGDVVPCRLDRSDAVFLARVDGRARVVVSPQLEGPGAQASSGAKETTP